jgi:hypothetical protein
MESCFRDIACHAIPARIRISGETLSVIQVGCV